MALPHKKLPIGGAVYMSLYKVNLRQPHPQLGPFEGGYSWSRFGPKSHSLHSCDFRAQKRLGLQQYPLKIAVVTDTAASNLLPTRTYKLHPPLIVILYITLYMYCGIRARERESVEPKIYEYPYS